MHSSTAWIAVLVLGASFASTTVACSGGVAEPDPGQQQHSSDSTGNATTTPSDQTKTGGGSTTNGTTGVVGNEGTGTEGTYSGDPCWKDFGPAVDGECVIGTVRDCDASHTGTSGGPGFCEQKCANIDGKATWGPITTNAQCPFYDTDWHVNAGPTCVCNDGSSQSSSTPLVLSFDDRAVSFTAAADATFDLTGNGVCHTSDWPTSATPWLALDVNGNGSIDDGTELFGSATKLSNGTLAKNGFEALRELDSDHNGVFDVRDEAFSKIVVWTDRNLDRKSTPSELTTLEAAGVKSIDLRDHRDMRCDTRGNCEGERSQLSFVSSTGETKRGSVVDVYVQRR